jgi:hypothetical protein
MAFLQMGFEPFSGEFQEFLLHVLPFVSRLNKPDEVDMIDHVSEKQIVLSIPLSGVLYFMA